MMLAHLVSGESWLPSLAMAIPFSVSSPGRRGQGTYLGLFFIGITNSIHEGSTLTT